LTLINLKEIEMGMMSNGNGNEETTLLVRAQSKVKLCKVDA
jgi:hypothetical protein